MNHSRLCIYYSDYDTEALLNTVRNLRETQFVDTSSTYIDKEG